MFRLSRALLCVTLAGFAATGCISPPSKEPKKAEVSDTTLWTLSSPDFTASGPLPSAFGCDGTGENPELDWNDGPDGTQSYAVVLKDISLTARMPDAATLSSAYYWAIWNVGPSSHQIPRGLSAAVNPPEVAGAEQWSPGAGAGYLAPCPNAEASGSAPRVTDHFAFTLYALPTPELDVVFDGDVNHAEAVDQELKRVALREVDLLFTSDAAHGAEGSGGAAGSAGAAAE